MRIAESRPMVSSWFSVPLTLVLGLGLTSALFLIEQQSIARYGLILPIGLLGTAPVSYTHLDVYKRQALPSSAGVPALMRS